MLNQNELQAITSSPRLCRDLCLKGKTTPEWVLMIMTVSEADPLSGHSLQKVPCRWPRMNCMLSNCQVQRSQHLAGIVHVRSLLYNLIKAPITIPLLRCRENKRAWLYRIRPSVTHEPFHPLDFPVEHLTGMLLKPVSAFAAWESLVLSQGVPMQENLTEALSRLISYDGAPSLYHQTLWTLCGA